MSAVDAASPIKLHASATESVRAGRFREAEGLFREAIRVAESQMGPSHPHVAKLAVSLVGLYENQGRYEEVRQLCERVVGGIDPAEAATANDHTLSRLGDFCRRAGQPHKAAELYRAAIKHRRQLFGNLHGKVAACVAGLAESYRDLGNVGKARSLLLRAISIAEEVEDDSAAALAVRLRELRRNLL